MILHLPPGKFSAQAEVPRIQSGQIMCGKQQEMVIQAYVLRLKPRRVSFIRHLNPINLWRRRAISNPHNQQSNIPVVESHQTIANPPQILPENVQSMVVTYKSVTAPP